MATHWLEWLVAEKIEYCGIIFYDLFPDERRF